MLGGYCREKCCPWYPKQIACMPSLIPLAMGLPTMQGEVTELIEIKMVQLKATTAFHLVGTFRLRKQHPGELSLEPKRQAIKSAKTETRSPCSWGAYVWRVDVLPAAGASIVPDPASSLSRS
eukprot:2309823-Amphidinium_carterae.1